MSQYKPGVRLHSAVCTTEVVVIAAPAGDIVLSCGGALLLEEGEEAVAGATLENTGEGTQLGKRYTDEAAELELLCVKPGEGALAANNVALIIKGAKPLPSSD